MIKGYRKKNYISAISIAVLLLVISFLILQNGKTKNSNGIVILTFGINLIFFFALLIRSIKQNSFSLDMMFWLFSFFFFGIAPLLQYCTGIYNWNLSPSNSEIIVTNLFILVFSLCYCIGNAIGKRSRIKQQIVEFKIRKKRLNILLAFSFIITVFVLWKLGFRNLLSSSTSSLSDSSSSIDLIMNHGLRNISLFVVVMHILYCKEKKHVSGNTIIATVLFVITCFPTSLSRNMLASFYGGLFIILLEKHRNKRLITYAIIFGLVLVFPAINVFRYIFETEQSNLLISMVNNIRNTYTEAHYDAHQMFISIQQYTNKFGFSYGKQLLGVILFFIPRSVWPGKPYGTGQTAFTMLAQHEFTNVAAPLVSEGYVNFGIIGIIILGFFVGMFTARIDKRYWAKKLPQGPLRVIYPFVMFKFFFILRGDLLSSWSYTVAQIVIGLLAFWFCTKKTRCNILSLLS